MVDRLAVGNEGSGVLQKRQGPHGMHGGCVLAYEGSDSKRGDRPYESGMFR